MIQLIQDGETIAVIQDPADLVSASCHNKAITLTFKRTTAYIQFNSEFSAELGFKQVIQALEERQAGIKNYYKRYEGIGNAT